MKHDDTNGQNVNHAPPKVVCPSPTAPVPDEHRRQSEHDKDDDREVQQKDDICESLIRHGECVCDN